MVLPPFPDALEPVWLAFVDLSGTRDRGLATGPITWEEIGAFNRETFAGLSVWQKKLIRRIDTAVLAVMAGVSNPKTQVPVSNAKGVQALFRGLAKRKDKARGDATAAP